MNKESIKVLVVDDEEEIVSMLAILIKGLADDLDIKIQVIAAKSSESAIEIVKAEKTEFDLLLTDFNCSECDKDGGFEVVQCVKSKSPDCKCIIMSGDLDNYIISKGKEIGVIDFFAKPFSLKRLITVIESLC